MQYSTSPFSSTRTTHTVARPAPGSVAANPSRNSSASLIPAPARSWASSTPRSCPMATAALVPWPTTSPTTSSSEPSARGTVSNQSPPAASSAEASTYRAATSNPGSTGTESASRARCTAWTLPRATAYRARSSVSSASAASRSSTRRVTS